MSSKTTIPPLLVIVGETASGKSALALQLADHFGGEIISADSRTVYIGMDIGTAKPTADERARVRHYGLDLVRPDERYSVADFKTHAVSAIDEITSRGKLPIMVGGTGLYIDSVVYDYQFRTPASAVLRTELDGLTVDQLQRRLADAGIPLPHNAHNPRHLIRAIETNGQESQRGDMRPRTLVLGLQTNTEILKDRIGRRVDDMLRAGFLDEIQSLVFRYGWDCEALQAPGYKAYRGYIVGTKTMEEAKNDFIRGDMNLAKRQRTWNRRNKSIHWLTTEDKQAEAVDIATTFLNK